MRWLEGQNFKRRLDENMNRDESGMDEYWIIPRMGDKEMPCVDHQLASCSLLNSYVLMFLSSSQHGGSRTCVTS